MLQQCVPFSSLVLVNFNVFLFYSNEFLYFQLPIRRVNTIHEVGKICSSSRSSVTPINNLLQQYLFHLYIQTYIVNSSIYNYILFRSVILQYKLIIATIAISMTVSPNIKLCTITFFCIVFLSFSNSQFFVFYITFQFLSFFFSFYFPVLNFPFNFSFFCHSFS